MRRGALDVLACPRCFGPLAGEKSVVVDDQEDGTLRCERDDLTFPVVGGVPHLVDPDRAPRLEAFAEAYSRVWRREGWGAPDAAYLLSLPERDTTGRKRGAWRVKARSMAALFDVLDVLRPRRVVDLGAGVGWLSHHLARRGHEVYAVDAVRDAVLGLGAAGVYVDVGPPFERVWGELERPPFRDASVDAVVCNASLHYASSLPDAVRAIGRILRPGGALVVLNSPVHRDGVSAVRAQTDFRDRLRRLGASEAVAATYHHFTRDLLHAVLAKEIGPVSDAPFDPGRLFRWVRVAKGLVLRMELASFPLLVARKPGADG